MLAEIFGADLVIVIVIVAVLLIGGTQIPKLARSLGSAKNQFEQGLKEGKEGKEGQAESAKSNGTSAASDLPAPAPAPAPPAEGKSQTG
jgi:sec-independent protein translocase protein TatA